MKNIFVIVFRSINVQDAPGGAENTRCNTNECHLFLRGKLSPNFWIVVFRRERSKTKEAVRLDVEAPKKYPCPTACASQWRQPSLSGDNTHAVATRPKWAQEHGLHTKCGSLCRWVASVAHRKVLETRTRANENVRPRPLVQRTGEILVGINYVIVCPTWYTHSHLRCSIYTIWG